MEEVAEAVRRQGERYLRRVYTDQEVADCGGRPRALAARFAAKEAAIKVLGAGEITPPWPSIAVCCERGGGVRLELTGVAQELADRRGITSLWVSLSAQRASALAVVVAQVGG